MKDNWITITNKSPKDGDKVLIFIYHGNLIADEYLIAKYIEDKQVFATDFDYYYHDDITAWQLLIPPTQ